MIIGTAGHIDHGKSALVAALTGRPMDRLAEERRRGITIDLNFAPLSLGNGTTAGVVDVPGHEDFVRTMVAGASGIDLALLVVAADEGIMPQTLEHLAVLEHLGVRAGIPVITKADLVDPDWLELVLAEVGDRLARSSVGFEAPIAVSAKSGLGLDGLRARLATRAAGLSPRLGADLFRLPVDRAFSDYLMYIRRRNRPFNPARDLSRTADWARPDSRWMQLGRYHPQLLRYYDRFPRTQLHVMLTGDLKRNAVGAVKELYRFI